MAHSLGHVSRCGHPKVTRLLCRAGTDEGKAVWAHSLDQAPGGGRWPLHCARLGQTAAGLCIARGQAILPLAFALRAASLPALTQASVARPLCADGADKDKAVQIARSFDRVVSMRAPEVARPCSASLCSIHGS